MDKDLRVHGVRVERAAGYDGISESRGLWGWKKIVIGQGFERLTPREQQAVVLHEVGHCKLRHLEKRLWWLALYFWSPRRLKLLCMTQEYEADRFAAACGYGIDLAQLFLRMKEDRALLHPDLRTRAARLLGG